MKKPAENAVMQNGHTSDRRGGVRVLEDIGQKNGSDAIRAPSHPELPARLLYPKAEAAVLLGISVRSLEYLVAGRRLLSRRVGKRVLIPATELQRFVRSDQPVHLRHPSDRRTA